MKPMYALVYRRGSKKGATPSTITMFQNPSSSDKEEMIRQGRNLWKNRDSNNVLAASVVEYVPGEAVWRGGDI